MRTLVGSARAVVLIVRFSLDLQLDLRMAFCFIANGGEGDFSMLDCMWQWLSRLEAAQAGFVGTLTGSVLGIVALIIGSSARSSTFGSTGKETRFFEQRKLMR